MANASHRAPALGVQVNRAINALVKRGDFQETNQGRKLRRVK